MKNILESRFVKQMREITKNMYGQGWDERNGGNISLMLEDGEAEQYCGEVIRTIPLGFDASEIKGKCFIVTGTG
ncbi:MAG: rhamnulose-1-phosphate aldolase, partial [Clostridia bacterium]|nr:rhamnulose-1-phosphate aldolase [Clostridia bacterium]